MAAFILTIGMSVCRLITLMAFCNDLIGDPFAQPVVKDKILSVEFIFNAFLFYCISIMNNAPLEVINIAKAAVKQICTCFFTTNAAGAKHHNWLALEVSRQITDGGWETAEMIDAQRDGVFERADLHLVIVSCIEQCEWPPFVKPAF